MFRLAGHLHKSVEEIEQLSSAELSEWMAFDMYHEPLANTWGQAGMIASAVLSPHCKKGCAPKPEDFIPRRRLPQTETQMIAELNKLKMLTGG